MEIIDFIIVGVLIAALVVSVILGRNRFDRLKRKKKETITDYGEGV
jgi:hypothetical protein